VVVTVRKIDASGSTFTSGDSLTATVSNSGAWDAEDVNGTTVTPTGSLTGNAVTFQATGITVTKVDASYNKSTGTTVGSGDTTQYSISWKVTAGDDDLYMARAITNGTTTSTTQVRWATTTSSTASSTDAGVASLSAGDTNSSDTASVFKIPSGTTRTFTLNVTLTAKSTGFTGVQLTSFAYGTTTAGTGNAYSSGLDTFKTADVSMSTH
jgi:hypothetical protein